MTLRVHYLCAYYSQWAHENIAPRSQNLWDAYKFCLAVKNKSINGYCTAPTKNPVRIDEDNVEQARRLFGLFMQQALGNEVFDGAVFVPVPSKDSYNVEDFRSLVMLRDALPNGYKDKAMPLVRFSEQRPKASEGGERGYNAVYPYLKVVGCAPSAPIYLVDDIVTSGGSLLATRDRLAESYEEVAGGIVCGRTTDQLETAFKIRAFELEDQIGELDF